MAPTRSCGGSRARHAVTKPASRRAPPGVSRTSNATPAQTNSIASVTMMSGTRESDDGVPLMAPMTTPRPRTTATAGTPHSSLAPSMRRAATTLVSAIIEPIDRSTPPVRTATSGRPRRDAQGRTAIARLPKRLRAEARLDDPREQQQDAEEHPQADHPGAPTHGPHASDANGDRGWTTLDERSCRLPLHGGQAPRRAEPVRRTHERGLVRLVGARSRRRSDLRT